MYNDMPDDFDIMFQVIIFHAHLIEFFIDSKHQKHVRTKFIQSTSQKSFQ